MTVQGTTGAASTANVDASKSVDASKGSVTESLKPAYDEAKASIKAMDDFLQQAENAQPGADPNIQKARADIKELDGALDKVFNSTVALEKAKQGGDPNEIVEKYMDAIDAQMDFNEKYQKASDSMEKATGFKLPALEG
jgi:hypothetical protein